MYILVLVLLLDGTEMQRQHDGAPMMFDSKAACVKVLEADAKELKAMEAPPFKLECRKVK